MFGWIIAFCVLSVVIGWIVITILGALRISTLNRESKIWDWLISVPFAITAISIVGFYLWVVMLCTHTILIDTGWIR